MGLWQVLLGGFTTLLTLLPWRPHLRVYIICVCVSCPQHDPSTPPTFGTSKREFQKTGISTVPPFYSDLPCLSSEVWSFHHHSTLPHRWHTHTHTHARTHAHTLTNTVSLSLPPSPTWDTPHPACILTECVVSFSVNSLRVCACACNMISQLCVRVFLLVWVFLCYRYPRCTVLDRQW